MATVSLYPRANGSIGANWTITGAASYWAATQAYNSGSSYIQIRNDLYAQRALFLLDTMPSTSGSALTITAHHYTGRNDISPGDYFGRWQVPGGGSNYDSSGHTTFAVSWVEQTLTPSSPPSMNEDDVNGAYFGIKSRGDASGTKRGRLERERIFVTYTPPAGLKIIAWALPLMGVISSAAQWFSAVAFSRNIDLNGGRNRKSLFGNQPYMKSNIHYSKLDLENLQKYIRDSRRSYAWL